MRYAFFSLALSLLAGPLAAFELEERVLFDSPGEGPTLRILSTTDIGLMRPVIEAFLEENPEISIDYHAASSTEVMLALTEEAAEFDVAISSAMDLQVRLANDGYAQDHRSDATRGLPEWARWHDQVFGFTLEPATIVLSRDDFEGMDLPQTRQDLIALLRDNPEQFEGRIGTYDVRTSGLGYLFATQDARTSETYWRLSEVMGGMQARLYCCSDDMIGDVASGEIAMAYNVLGSYADARTDLHEDIHIIRPEDFTTVMMRTAVIPETAQAPDAAGLFVDHLIESSWAQENSSFSFLGVTPQGLAQSASLRPIQLGPGLLVYLDRLKRRQFLEEWSAALVQQPE